MEKLKEMLSRDGVLGVVRSASGETRLFRRRGVVDMYELLTGEPELLRGASVADRVIGRGAALMLVRGGVAEVYARLISLGAAEVLHRAGVRLTSDCEVPYIRNRQGDGMCPVERLTADTDSPEEACRRIGQFLHEMKEKNKKQDT